MLSTFGNHTLEAKASHPSSDFVVVHEFGVAEHFRLLSEELVNHFVVSFHLATEFFEVAKRSERVSEGFRKEFYATGSHEFLQEVDEFRNVLLKLLDGSAADRESNLKLLAVVLNDVEQHLSCRDVRIAGNASDYFVVVEVVEIVVVVTDIEETIFFQAIWLVYMKIKTNSFHCVITF